MKSILQQLYDGEIVPYEQYQPQNKEYKQMEEKHFRHYEEFAKQLDEPLREQFVKLMDEQGETTPYRDSEMFIQGFKLGARMMLEILSNREE